MNEGQIHYTAENYTEILIFLPTPPECWEVMDAPSFPVVVVKHPDKSSLREKGFIWLTVPGYSPSLLGSQDSHYGKWGIQLGC